MQKITYTKHMHVLRRFIRSSLPRYLSAVFLAIVSTSPIHALSPLEIGMATSNTLLNIPDSQLEHRLDDMQRLGVKWLRVDFSWATIQPHNARNFDFRFHTKVVDSATKRGMKILATLGYTPAWARDPLCSRAVTPVEESRQKCTPRDASEFARFAHETAWYFQDRIAAWEIWNEPNLTGYWKDPQPDGSIWVNPQSFGRLASMAGDAIHQIRPGVPVIAGGLAPVFDAHDPRGMRQSDFLRAALPHLLPGSVTAIAIHPYTWPALPRQHEAWNAFYTTDGGPDELNLQKILQDNGRGDMTIWGTEYGASTISAQSDSTDPAVPSRPDSISESAQAATIQQGITDWYAKSNVGPLFVYADSDQYLPQYRNEGGFGLRRQDGSAKPAYTEFMQTLTTIQANR